MAPLRVTMTDLDGTRLNPEPPCLAEIAPRSFQLGPLRRALDRTGAKASQRAAPDAISSSAPSPGTGTPAPSPGDGLGKNAAPRLARLSGTRREARPHIRAVRLVPVAMGRRHLSRARHGDVRRATPKPQFPASFQAEWAEASARIVTKDRPCEAFRFVIVPHTGQPGLGRAARR